MMNCGNRILCDHGAQCWKTNFNNQYASETYWRIQDINTLQVLRSSHEDKRPRLKAMWRTLLRSSVNKRPRKTYVIKILHLH